MTIKLSNIRLIIHAECTYRPPFLLKNKTSRNKVEHSSMHSQKCFTPSHHHRTWPTDSVKLNQYVKHLGQRSFRSKVSSEQTDIQTDTRNW